MYKDKAVVTASDYTVVDTVMINGVSYSVEWSSDVDASSVSFVPGDKHMVTVDVNEKSHVDVSYTLTATLSDSVGNTETVSFPHTIPASGFCSYTSKTFTNDKLMFWDNTRRKENRFSLAAAS